MNKFGTDPKVKKTLIRNCEQKIRTATRKQVVREVNAFSSRLPPAKSTSSLQKEDELTQPSLCSSEALANYLSDVKISMPPPLSTEDLNADRGQLCSKMTRQLNFHFTDSIYKNLIELNASYEDLRTRKDKRPASSITSAKKDLEPNIEDFCEDEKEMDLPPNITVIKPKFKPLKKMEDGQLHRLVASFDVL